jgi:hypothetical protein
MRVADTPGEIHHPAGQPWHGQRIRQEVSPVRIVEFECEYCASLSTFEQPPCQDDHGADCDEWACVECGTAILVASFTAARQSRRRVSLARRAA